ncbi:CDP-glucose 4,6-dehydratase [Ideonella sp. A 288]|uniref:CDP-glucose 4,6-dehydratase n=1 Tax=Ideonella sp. A 288 TaxID=1962181 RepID=UPI001F396582|nr:CDP-glucose 4,6-dehydratase [Ideonella sp. A 288]
MSAAREAAPPAAPGAGAPHTAFGGAFAGKRVLITGHTGFKGAWLGAWLRRLGAHVSGYAIDVPTTPSLFDTLGGGASIDHHLGDVRDAAAVERVLRRVRPDYVFHLAAQAIVSTSYDDPLATLSTNVMGTATVLDALRRIGHRCTAVVITSDKCYENVEWVYGYRETDAMGGKDIYSASKGAAEHVFHAFQRSFFADVDGPVRLASARAGNVIGGGDWARDRIVVDCMVQWAEGRPVEIRSPRATRPWQHVLEPLSGYLALAARLQGDPALHGESFNFGPNAEQNRSVLELLQDLGRCWGHDDPSSLYTVTEDRPFNEAGLLKLNCDKALAQLRWQATLRYDECVRLVGDWYHAYYRGPRGTDMAALTAQHIARYEALAAERGLAWAAR